MGISHGEWGRHGPPCDFHGFPNANWTFKVAVDAAKPEDVTSLINAYDSA
jgi:hypothetical protein